MIKILNVCSLFKHKAKYSGLINSGKLNHGFFIKKLIIIIFPLLLIAQGNYSFGPNVKVNDDPGGQAFHTVYCSGAHTIAARGDTVYIAYRGDQTDSAHIYFSKSIDCGETWTPGLRVNYPNMGFLQSLAVSPGGDIFITYTHYDTNGKEDIHFTKSTDGGLSFSYPIMVSDDTLSQQWFSSIAVNTSGENVFVAWADYRNWSVSGLDIYFTRSTDGGATFSPNIRVDDTGNDSSWQRSPGIAVDRGGDNVYITWCDNRTAATDYDIYFARSTDAGVSFLPNVLVNDTVASGSSRQTTPTIAIDTLGRIFIAWQDYQIGNHGCFCARSDDGGLSFGNNIKVSEGDRNIDHPSIAVDDSNGVYIAWSDIRLSGWNHRIFFAFSPNAGDSFLPNVRVDDLPVNENYWLWNPTLAINKDKNVFIAWGDDRNDPTHTNPDIYFASGTYVGIQEYYVAQPKPILVQCQPNPFRNQLTFKFRILDSRYTIQKFSLKIYDVSGRLVKNLSKDLESCILYHASGVVWDGRDAQGQSLPCGTYFIELSNGETREIKKVVKVK